MIVVIDFITFLLSLVLMGSVFFKYKKVDTLFLLLLLSVVINCMGRYMISSAEQLETAVWANKFLYIGGSYAPILFVCLLFKLSNIKFPKVVATVLGIYSSVVLFFVMTAEKNKLYYKKMTLVITDEYSYLDKTYGPMHSLYTGMMIFYAAFIIVFIVSAIRTRHKLSYKSIIGLSCAGLAIMLIYVMEKLLDLKISVLSVGYIVGLLYLIRYFDRLNMYDMSANVINSVEQRGEYGYIVFDNNTRYVSSNGYIKEIFPEINSWKVDHVVLPSNSKLYTQVVDFFVSMEWKNGKNQVVEEGGKFFEVSIRPLMRGKKKIGFLIEIVDRTIERKYYNSIENYNVELENEVAKKTENILHIQDMMVLGMADMVESRDNSTGGHIKRTSAIVKVFSGRLMERSEEIGVTDKFLKQVVKAAPMHDLGKIAIDDSILRKPGKFTDEEYAEMKRHTTEGARIVSSILQSVEDEVFVEIAKNVALYHHEKYNGRGYPQGVSGENIPLEARIMALADVFDALVSVRCYKNAFTFDEAFEIIEKDLGEHFDPQLGRIFIECREELEEIMPTL
ncbi:MAG: HD domain-containing protein [Oscillospiraceae bacterium]|nr:HD domain-containing protein [Oscillospiraceae bacterium]